MIPLAAALSNCASTEDVTVALFADFAFLKRVFRRVFVSRFRSVRFSLWRTHLTAALILGTKSRLPQLRPPVQGPAGRLDRCVSDDVLVGGVPARRDAAFIEPAPHGAVGLGQMPAV